VGAGTPKAARPVSLQPLPDATRYFRMDHEHLQAPAGAPIPQPFESRLFLNSSSSLRRTRTWTWAAGSEAGHFGESLLDRFLLILRVPHQHGPSTLKHCLDNPSRKTILALLSGRTSQNPYLLSSVSCGRATRSVTRLLWATDRQLVNGAMLPVLRTIRGCVPARQSA
jgi:hypothetical protein